MKFRAMTDKQWRYMEPLHTSRRGWDGKLKVYDKRTIGVILYFLKTGIP